MDDDPRRRRLDYDPDQGRPGEYDPADPAPVDLPHARPEARVTVVWPGAEARAGLKESKV